MYSSEQTYRGENKPEINKRTGQNKRTGGNSELKQINVQAKIHVQGKIGITEIYKISDSQRPVAQLKWNLQNFIKKKKFGSKCLFVYKIYFL